MNRTACRIVALVFVLTLALAPGGMAQPQQPPDGPPPPPPRDKPAATDAEEQEPAPMRPPRHDMMGHAGMELQPHLERLTQQLKLSDEQRAQVLTLMRNHAKDVLRLRAEIDTTALDVPPLLDADPVDFAQVKQLLQTIAAKEADLHLAHITAMHDIRKLLSPGQQKKFRMMQGHMMGEAGMMGRGMMEHGSKAP